VIGTETVPPAVLVWLPESVMTMGLPAVQLKVTLLL